MRPAVGKKPEQHIDSLFKFVSAKDVLTLKSTSLLQDFHNMKQKNVKRRMFFIRDVMYVH